MILGSVSRPDKSENLQPRLVGINSPGCKESEDQRLKSWLRR